MNEKLKVYYFNDGRYSVVKKCQTKPWNAGPQNSEIKSIKKWAEVEAALQEAMTYLQTGELKIDMESSSSSESSDSMSSASSSGPNFELPPPPPVKRGRGRPRKLDSEKVRPVPKWKAKAKPKSRTPKPPCSATTIEKPKPKEEFKDDISVEKSVKLKDIPFQLPTPKPWAPEFDLESKINEIVAWQIERISQISGSDNHDRRRRKKWRRRRYSSSSSSDRRRERKWKWKRREMIDVASSSIPATKD